MRCTLFVCVCRIMFHMVKMLVLQNGYVTLSPFQNWCSCFVNSQDSCNRCWKTAAWYRWVQVGYFKREWNCMFRCFINHTKSVSLFLFLSLCSLSLSLTHLLLSRVVRYLCVSVSPDVKAAVIDRRAWGLCVFYLYNDKRRHWSAWGRNAATGVACNAALGVVPLRKAVGKWLHTLPSRPTFSEPQNFHLRGGNKHEP